MEGQFCHMEGSSTPMEATIPPMEGLSTPYGRGIYPEGTRETVHGFSVLGGVIWMRSVREEEHKILFPCISHKKNIQYPNKQAPQPNRKRLLKCSEPRVLFHPVSNKT